MKALAKSCKHSELIAVMSCDLKPKYSVSSYIANSSPESTLYYSPPFSPFDNGNGFFNTLKKNSKRIKFQVLLAMCLSLARSLTWKLLKPGVYALCNCIFKDSPEIQNIGSGQGRIAGAVLVLWSVLVAVEEPAWV